MRRALQLTAIAAIIGGPAIVAADGTNPFGKTGVRAAPADQPRLAPPGGTAHACDILTPAIARDFVGGLKLLADSRTGRVRPVRDRRNGSNRESCTYMSRRADRGVTVSLYPADGFDSAIQSVPGMRVSLQFGGRAAFNDRLGYLIELPNRPFYLQATFQHVKHLHADRRWSRKLARRVLGVEKTTAGSFLCSLTGKRKT